MKRNTSLANKIKTTVVGARTREAASIPRPTSVNKSGSSAYEVEDELKLIAMLNTLKLENQFYRKDSEQVAELEKLITKIGKRDPYFVAQAIVYSRCLGEGMRSINQLAAILLAKHISGSEWADRFYSLWNRKEKAGGMIYRPDDMYEILEGFKAYTKNGFTNKGLSLTNAMKRGFRRALENMDAFSMLKYKNKLIDLINLVRPNPNRSAKVVHNNKRISVIDAIMKGYPIAADTWEVNNSEAGQLVSAAVKDSLISKTEAAELLSEAKASNWKGLLRDGKLGILAALRNIRNILSNNPDNETITMLGALISNPDAIRNGKIMPHQIDIAREVVLTEFGYRQEGRTIADYLLLGYELAIPNLQYLLPGRSLVMLDVSRSMQNRWVKMSDGKEIKTRALDKGALLAATIAKGVNADVIQFGSKAKWATYDKNLPVFEIASRLHADMGATSIAAAWQLAKEKKYDRVFIFSDYEANKGSTYDAYRSYVMQCGSPYVYSVDLNVYGTTQMKGDKVKYLYGYGFGLFDDIVNTEFNPYEAIEKVRKIRI